MRQNSDCCFGWQKKPRLLPNWPAKQFCNRPMLIHAPHGIIYKGAEGTFIRGQKTRGLVKENIHLEVEEWSTLGFLTKQVHSESSPFRDIWAWLIGLFSHSWIKEKAAVSECFIFENRNSLNYHHATSHSCKQTGCQRRRGCQPAFCAEVLWRIHLVGSQHLPQNWNTAEMHSWNLLIPREIPSGD